jgi:hypothetical protein
MAVPVLLFLVALGARVLTAALFPEPAYPDAYYYVNVAEALAAGRGLQVDYVWNFIEVGGRLPEVGSLPIPSNAHWMPLAALVQVPFIWLLGPTALASGLPFWLAAAAVAPLTYLIGVDAGVSRWQAATAGVLVAFPGGLAPFLGQPDNFALFMLLGTLSLWLCGRGIRGDRRAFAIGGPVVGLAFLARTDGILLGIPFALAFLVDLGAGRTGQRIGWRAALLCAAGFLLVAAPWLLRQQDVFGSLSPSSAGGRVLWIGEYRELYSVTSEATLEAFLAQGPASVAWSRLGGLASALVLFAVLPLLVFLAPVLLVGAWKQRRDPVFMPWLVYASALFLFSALVSAVHVPFGTFIHSAVALVPHAYLLAVLGIGAVVTWVADRRPAWRPAVATRRFTAMAAGVAVLGALAASVVLARAWSTERDGRAPLLAALERVAGPHDRVMSPDAGAYRYLGGWPGIVTPDDPLPVVEQALRLYDVRWLALERDHITTSLAPLLAGDERPEWLSDPVVVVDDPSAEVDSEAGGGPATALPRAALFRVCLDASDPRCGA